jgi:CheY-like chemotaxis protein
MATILVVEDDDQVRGLIVKSLRRAGHAVRELCDGQKVLDELDEIDLLITDIFMPHCDGIETIRVVRTVSRALPIIAISGGSRIIGVDYLQSAGLLGASAVMTKPFLPAELIALVDQVFARTPPVARRANPESAAPHIGAGERLDK